MSKRTIRNLSGLIISAIVAFPQAPAPAEFEAASVRPNTANDRIVTINVGPGGRFTARGYTLVLLMQRAYEVMDWNVTGGPGWIRTDRFDVTAKAGVEGNLTEEQMRPMLRRLLAERFKLTIRKTSREMPGYALVVARGGEKVKAISDVEGPTDSFRLNAEGLAAQGITMADLARYVGGKLGLVVVDKTGLKGAYNLKADWKVEPEQYTGGLPGVDPRDGLRLAVFRALQDQLGLKITAQKIEVELLVIEHAEKASEN